MDDPKGASVNHVWLLIFKHIFRFVGSSGLMMTVSLHLVAMTKG
jgi:hypothetical protein